MANFNENFTYADGALTGSGIWTVESGSPFGASSGTEGVSGNQMVLNAASTFRGYYRTASSLVDLEVEIDVVSCAGVGEAALTLRRQSASNFYLALFCRSGGLNQVRIYKVVSGVMTELGSGDPVAFALTAGDRVSFKAVGNTLTVSVTRASVKTQLKQVTDSTFTTSGNDGFGSDFLSATYDNYSVTDLFAGLDVTGITRPTTSINLGDPFSPTVNHAGGAGAISYVWKVDGAVISGATTANPTIPFVSLPAGSRTIRAEVTRGAETDFFETTVFVGQIGGTTPVYTATQAYTTNVSNPVWSIVSGGGSINSATGVYTKPTSGSGSAVVKATNGSDSTEYATKTISYAAPAVASFDLSATSINSGGTVSATDNSGGIGTIQRRWYVDNVLVPSLNDQSNPTFTGLSNGSSHAIKLEITDDAGMTTTTRNVWVGEITGESALVNGEIAPYASNIIGTLVWSVVSGGGSINPSTGAYTAPAVGTGTVVLKATKSGDATVFNTKTVTYSVDAASPSQVTGVTAAATGGTTILVSYDAATDNSGGGLKYVVEYSLSPTFSSGISSIESTVDVLSVTIPSLNPNTKYYVRVKAKDPAGNLSTLHSTTRDATTDNVLIFAPDSVLPVDGKSVYGFSGTNSTWSSDAGTLWLDKACTQPYLPGENSTSVYLKVTNIGGTGTLTNAAMGTMTMTITGVMPSLPHYPMEWETNKLGVVLLIARDGTPSGRILGNGQMTRDYRLVFNNRKPSEVIEFENFWDNHYPHKTFKYDNKWHKIVGTFRFDSKIKGRAKGVQNGDFEVAIAEVK